MRPGWLKMPLEPAAPWMRLPALTRALGSELFRLWQDRVLEGISLDDVEDVVLRAMSPDQAERKALRRAVRSLLEAGLIAAVGTGVRLLYTAESYTNHMRTVAQPHADHAATTSQPHADRRVSVSDKPSESHDRDLQIDREKEREREKKEPARWSACLQQKISERFFAANQPSQGASKSQLLGACQRVQDALDQKHFARGEEACQALAEAAVTAALKPGGKLGFALLQEPFTAARRANGFKHTQAALEAPEDV